MPRHGVRAQPFLKGQCLRCHGREPMDGFCYLALNGEKWIKMVLIKKTNNYGYPGVPRTIDCTESFSFHHLSQESSRLWHYLISTLVHIKGIVRIRRVSLRRAAITLGTDHNHFMVWSFRLFIGPARWWWCQTWLRRSDLDDISTLTIGPACQECPTEGPRKNSAGC